MVNLSVKNKTGFYSPTDVKIYDDKGHVFYEKSCNNKNQGQVFFNLPEGEFTSENKVHLLNRPLRYILPALPFQEHIIPIPEDIEIIKTDNPHTCTILLATGKILCDYKVFDWPLANRTHVLFHELGHYYYKTESKCDIFASRKMLKIGYNPSQLAYVTIKNLRPSNAKRILKHTNYLSEVHYE